MSAASQRGQRKGALTPTAPNGGLRRVVLDGEARQQSVDPESLDSRLPCRVERRDPDADPRAELVPELDPGLAHPVVPHRGLDPVDGHDRDRAVRVERPQPAEEAEVHVAGQKLVEVDLHHLVQVGGGRSRRPESGVPEVTRITRAQLRLGREAPRGVHIGVEAAALASRVEAEPAVARERLPGDERGLVRAKAAVGQRRVPVAFGQAREAVPLLPSPAHQLCLHRQGHPQLAPGLVGVFGQRVAEVRAQVVLVVGRRALPAPEERQGIAVAQVAPQEPPRALGLLLHALVDLVARPTEGGGVPLLDDQPRLDPLQLELGRAVAVEPALRLRPGEVEVVEPAVEPQPAALPERPDDLQPRAPARREVRLPVGRGVEDVRVDAHRPDVDVGREVEGSRPEEPGAIGRGLAHRDAGRGRRLRQGGARAAHDEGHGQHRAAENRGPQHGLCPYAAGVSRSRPQA